MNQSKPHIPKKFVCTRCGCQGRMKTYVQGSFLLELILWIFGLLFCLFFFISMIPAICYSLWRVFSKYKACPECAGVMIRTSTPLGQKILTEVKQ